MLSWPTKLPPSSIGESMPKFNPESGPRSDGGGVPDRGNPSPKPLPDYAPDTLITYSSVNLVLQEYPISRLLDAFVFMFGNKLVN
ncbi:hypothetical protein Hanom_Chr17g01542101 [Helianthus anomalus]